MVLGHPGRPLTRAMRVWFVIDTVLVAAAGVQLLVLATQTERFFAWTVQPPVSAALLGASYWGAIPLVWLASRQTRWTDAGSRCTAYGCSRCCADHHAGAPGSIQLGDPELTARAAAWAWLVVYLVVSVALLLLVVLQLRVPRRRAAPAGAAAAHVPAGPSPCSLRWPPAPVCCCTPHPGSVPWPWPLTSLTSQALGAWLIGIAVILAQIVWENDWRRVRIALPGLVVLGVLYLAIVLGYAGSIDWTNPFTVGLVGFAIGLIACGGYGWRAARRAASILTSAGSA